MNDTITLIRKYKKQRLSSIASCVITCLLLFVWYVAVFFKFIEDVDSVFLYITVNALFGLVIFLVISLFTASMQEIQEKIEKILYYESDPEKYGQVFFAVFRSNKKTAAVWQANAAFLTGQFEDCLQYCKRMKALKNQDLLYEIAFNRARTAAMLGDSEMLDDEIGNMEWHSPLPESRTAHRDAEKELAQMKMLLDLLEGNTEDAVYRADMLHNDAKYPIDDALLSYYRGLVYRKAGQTVKAIHCFMTASEKGGKTFVKAKSDEYLEELKLPAEPAPAGQTEE